MAGNATRCRRAFTIPAALILVSAVIVYLNSFSVPFQFDDHLDIVGNPNIRNFDAILHPSQAVPFGDAGYVRYFGTRIVGFATLALNYRFSGLDVAGYHLVNLVVHVANAILLFAIMVTLGRMCGCEGKRNDTFVAAALLAGLLFAVHPVQTQAVTYVKQRFASLAALFYLSGFLCYLRFRACSYLGRHGRSVAWYLAGVILAVAGMRTKETVFTLPLAITLAEVMFCRGPAIRRTAAVLPFLLTMLVIPLSFLAFGDAGDVARVQTDMSRSQYLLSELPVIVMYLRLLVFPVMQNLDYDVPVFTSLLQPPVFLSALVIAGLSCTAVVLARKSKAIPHLRIMAFGICWFFLALSVESGLVPIVDLANEHRVYLPSAGFFMALSVSVHLAMERLRTISPHGGRYLAAACGVVIVVLGVATIRRNIIWQSDLTLWHDVVAKSPAKPRGVTQLAIAYSDRGEFGKALPLFERALSLKPDDPLIHINLGVALFRMRRLDDAERTFKRAITLGPRRPQGYDGIGAVRFVKGDMACAERLFLKALELDPAHDDARRHLAAVRQSEGRDRDMVQSAGGSYGDCLEGR